MGGGPSHQGPAPRISRRRALAAVTWGVAALSGCTLHRAAVHASSSTTLLGLGPPVPPAAIAAAVKTQFTRDNPGFAVVYPADHDPDVRWWLELDFPQDATVDLGPALTALNFDPGLLPEPLWAVVAPSGRLANLPYGLAVTAIGYSPAALVAAGAKLPAPDWTWDDFVLVCAQVDVALRAGRLEKLGIQSVLPYMAGDPRRYGGLGSLYYGPLWTTFVRGFGGDIVENGRAAVGSPAAVAGVTAFVDVVRRFGNVSTAPLPTPFRPVPDGVALNITSLPHQAPVPSGQAGPTYARFPKLPSRAFVPTEASLRGLHDAPDSLSRVLPNVVVPQRVTEGAARFFIWRCQYAQQELFANARVIPLTDAQGLQQRFFRDTYAMDIAPEDLHFPEVSELDKAVSSSWLDGLEAAVADPARVPALLGELSQLIDAALAKQGDG